MSFSINILRSLSTLTLLLAISNAQQCYYPDGSEATDHTPCSSISDVSHCCGVNSFCTNNGLCYGGGLLSRGSCTDNTWNSEECGSYCRTVKPSTSVNLMPCTATSFTCGLNATNCATNTTVFTVSGDQSFLLRDDQVASLVSPVLEASAAANQVTVTVTATALPTNTEDGSRYTNGDMAGVACGLGLPLFFALVASLLLLRRERQKHAPPKLMYKLPDGHENFDPRDFKPAAHLHFTSNAAPIALDSRPPSSQGSFAPVAERSNSQLGHVGTFMERYDSMKKTHITPADVHRHELESAPPYKSAERHELSSNRMSRGLYNGNLS